MRDQGPDVSEYVEATETDELRRIISDLQTKYRQAKARTADLIQAVHQGARDAAVVLGKSKPVPKPTADRRRKRQEEVALLHVSDWQLGKVTESYDSEIAGHRVDCVAGRVVKITEIERADHPVKSCHVMLGGDMCEGVAIFPGQAFEVDSNLFRQVFSTVSALESLLLTMLANFERVEAWEEYGNHGRLGRKGDHPGEDSADLMIYRLVRERLEEYEDEGRLVWHPFEETTGKFYSIVEFENYRALLVHGDEIKQFGGNLPAFGIARKVNAWAAGVIEPFTDCYMGHFHQPMVLPLASGKGRVFINPSLESDNVYAQEFVAATGTPAQRLNFVDPDKGRVTSERLIYADDVT